MKSIDFNTIGEIAVLSKADVTTATSSSDTRVASQLRGTGVAKGED